MKHFKQSLFLFILIALSFNSLAMNMLDELEYYIEKYKLADSSNELVRRVDNVFKKVRRVADKNHKRPPHLAIIKGFNTKNDPLAMALPDGGIVLSKHAIEVFYKNVSLADGDIRAAFVLGHELAHLAKDDFSHREFLHINSPLLSGLITTYRKQDGKQKEIEADAYGFRYAAMAGYRVDKLLAKNKTNQDFFLYWQEQNFQAVNDSHPNAATRAEHLQMRLRKLLDSVRYFHFGVRLSHFQRCDDAVYFFREFMNQFSGHQVYNNLGVCELQKARIFLGDDAYLYWFPSVLDVTVPTDKFSLPYNYKGERNTLADESLKKAKEFFELAFKMDNNYVPAKINLAITTFYLEEYYEARAAIEKAHELAPNDLDIEAMRAVIIYEQGKQMPYVDMWPRVIHLLDNLMEKSNLPPSVLYNTAKLLDARKRTGAEKIWQQLAQRLTELPEPIRKTVCKNTTCTTQQRQKSEIAKWNLPVKFGVKARRDKTLRKWQKGKRRLYKINERIYREPNDAAEVLALRGRVEMVVLKQLNNIRQKDLAAYCVQALREREVLNGKLWSCTNWAALVVDDEVKEVWVVKDKR